MTDEDRIKSYLACLQSHAPDNVAQEQCAKMLHDIQEDGCTPHQIELLMVGALWDGLCYGNWPWSGRSTGK
jgi:hypothetical protein